MVCNKKNSIILILNINFCSTLGSTGSSRVTYKSRSTSQMQQPQQPMNDHHNNSRTNNNPSGPSSSLPGSSSSGSTGGTVPPQLLPDQQHLQGGGPQPPPGPPPVASVTSIGGYSNQQQLTPAGSSYVNFNLSTIFPEINVPPPGPSVPPGSDKIAASNLLRTSASSIVTSSVPPPIAAVVSSSASSALSADFRSIPSTPDLLAPPPGIPIFGPSTSHQMGFGTFSVASSFSSSPLTSTATMSHNFNLNE